MQISYGHYRGIRMSDRIDRLDPQCSRGLARYKQELALRNSRFVLRWSGRATRPIHRERSEEHTSELQSQSNLVCRLLLEKKKKTHAHRTDPTTTPRHTC